MNIFKRSSEPPAAKASAFTADQIIQDVMAVMKQNDNNDSTNPFFVNHSEAWYADLKEYTDTTNSLLDIVENGAEQKDELLKLKTDLKKDVNDLKNKTQEILQNN